MRVFVIASGPSLAGFDFHRLDNDITISTNYNYRDYVPTILVFVDNNLYTDNKDEIDRLDCIRIGNKKHFGWGHKTVLGLPMISNGAPFEGAAGLTKGLYCTYLTGLVALSLAIALKLNPIYLLGYDCGFETEKVEPEVKSRRKRYHRGHYYTHTRHHGDTEAGLKVLIDGVKKFDTFINHRDTKDTKIVDCSMKGKLNQFPKQDINTVLSPHLNLGVRDKSGHPAGKQAEIERIRQCLTR